MGVEVPGDLVEGRPEARGSRLRKSRGGELVHLAEGTGAYTGSNWRLVRGGGGLATGRPGERGRRRIAFESVRTLRQWA